MGSGECTLADNAATKYAPLDQIDRANVRALKVAWRRPQVPPDIPLSPARRPNNNYRSTPIMVDGVLYASNGLGLAEAFDPATGATIWVQKPGDDPLRGSASLRGLAYWTDGKERRVFSYRNQYLYALDAKTGEVMPSFGTGGQGRSLRRAGPACPRLDLERRTAHRPGRCRDRLGDG